MVSLDTLQLTPEFVSEFRKLGKQVGYRNLGRAIAYSPPNTALLHTAWVGTPSIAPNGNGHKPTCKETAESIRELMGGQLPDLSRQVHNHRVQVAYNAEDDSLACPCGDTKFQYPEVAYHAPKLRAAPRSRPYKGKRTHDCPGCQKDQAHRFTHKVKWPFTYSILRRRGWNEADPSSVSLLCYDVAAAMPTRKCCGRKMGLTPDYTDAHHWRYQCDKNPDHCQDVMITIGPS